MAHELGHLFLPADAHGPTGVMRADWDVNDMRLMRSGRLMIATREASLIRLYLDSIRN